MAQVLGDGIVDMVMPFVEANISKNTTPEDWRFREAATITFGSVLEGPSMTKLKPLVNQALPFLLTAAVNDAHKAVKDTTCWAIGKIFEVVHDYDPANPGAAIVRPELIPQIMHVLKTNLAADESLALRCCYAAAKFVEGYNGERGSPIVSVYQELLQALLEVTNRHDGANLMVEACESVNEVIDATPLECMPLMTMLYQYMAQKLHVTLGTNVQNAEHKEKQMALQGYLLSTITSILAKVNNMAEEMAEFAGTVEVKKQFQGQADGTMELLLRVFQCHPDTVHFEALLAAGPLLQLVGSRFDQYLQHFMPWLLKALEAFTEEATLKVAMSFVGQLADELKSNILVHCDDIVRKMLEALHRNDVQREVKPVILSCFGDIASGIGNDFARYMQEVSKMLKSACELSAQIEKQAAQDEDLADYNNELRKALFESYSGIIHGMDENSSTAAFQADISWLLAFIHETAKDDSKDESVTIAAVNLLGDIAKVIHGSGAAFKASPGWVQMLDQCKRLASDPQHTSEARPACQYAEAEIQAAMTKCP